MNAFAVGFVVFFFCSAGFLFGMFISYRLPEHHLSSDSKDIVKLGIGLIATITALVLGLVTASVKSSFDDLNLAVKRSATEILILDRTLARYGPETKGIREELRTLINHRMQVIWYESSRSVTRDTIGTTRSAERLEDEIRGLSPQNDDQRWLKSKAIDVSENLLNARWVLVSGAGSSVPRPFVGILIFWLTVTFGSFGLFAPRNATVVGVLLVCAISMGCAMFLILAMASPFAGPIKISPDPLRFAASQIGQ